jgi:hypothetical protein
MAGGAAKLPKWQARANIVPNYPPANTMPNENI